MEVHRRPEYYACSFPECGVTFPRKIAFIRHLIQEHKLSAPMKKRKTLSKEQLVPPDDKEETLREIVEQCHREDPSAEKLCRFYGANLSSWGKLRIHLAKHMEELAVPILEMVNQSLGSEHSWGLLVSLACTIQ